jgi:hypothetical protein
LYVCTTYFKTRILEYVCRAGIYGPRNAVRTFRITTGSAGCTPDSYIDQRSVLHVRTNTSTPYVHTHYPTHTHTYATTHVAALAACTAESDRTTDAGRGRARAGPPVPTAAPGIPSFAAHASTCPSPFSSDIPLAVSPAGRSAPRSLSVRPRNHRLWNRITCSLLPVGGMERWWWWFAAETYSE